MNNNVSIRLSLCGGALMLSAGVILAILQQLLYAALLWLGAFGCFIAALNYKSENNG